MSEPEQECRRCGKDDVPLTYTECCDDDRPLCEGCDLHSGCECKRRTASGDIFSSDDENRNDPNWEGHDVWEPSENSINWNMKRQDGTEIRLLLDFDEMTVWKEGQAYDLMSLILIGLGVDSNE